MNRCLYSLTISLSFCLLLVACQTPPPEQTSLAPELVAAAAAEQIRLAKEQELDQALDLYATGQFPLAIAALRPLIDTPELSTASRLRAIKFTAFSHCVQGQAAVCRQFFEQALKTDSNFQLVETEASHPLWGAEFRRAQRNIARNPNAAGRSADRTP